MDNENQREPDVLAALEGIHRMQESIRDTELDMVVETGIIFLRLHYQRLPPGVARRLTEISPRDVAEVSEVIRENGATPEQRRSLGDRLASDAAHYQKLKKIKRLVLALSWHQKDIQLSQFMAKRWEHFPLIPMSLLIMQMLLGRLMT